MQTALTTSKTALAGSRLATRQQSASRAAARLAVQAIFTKAKTTAEPKTAKKGKTLVTGRDVKATQFEADLGVTKKRITLGFTASNELFVGRAAMLGVAASIIGELLTGRGALAQLGYEFHESLLDVEWEILFVIGFNLIAALLPTKGRFVPEEEDLEGRPAGALQDPKISLASNPKKFLGVTGFGWTKQNEIFVGRVAQLGFAISLIGEALTGKGILGQIGLETGLPLSETEPLLLAFIAFTVLAAANEGSGKFVDEE